MELTEALRGRRSIRQLDNRPVPDDLVVAAIESAFLAPAPHHTRPWRYVIVSAGRRHALAAAMGSAWRADLARDGHPADRIERLLHESERRIVEAPALVLACLTHEGLRDWPDEQRQRNEWAMAQQSLGAGLQNLMLAAHNAGLASYWISAPLFAPEAVRAALDLPTGWVAQALVAVGYPAPRTEAKPRPPMDLTSLLLKR